jgi:hypothetical protein
MSGGNSEILLLDKKDTQDFIGVLRGAHSLIDDCQRQVALFKFLRGTQGHGAQVGPVPLPASYANTTCSAVTMML